MNTNFDKVHLELFEAIQVGLAVTDENGKLIFINQAYADLIGYSKEEAINLTYWDVTPKSYQEQELKILEQIENDKKYGPYDKEYTHKEGYLVPVRLNGRIIEINGNKFLLSTVEGTLFSKTKSVQVELESKNNLIENSISEIYIFDYKTLKFLYTNKSARKNTGYSIEEFKKMSPLNLKPMLTLNKFQKMIDPLIKNETDLVRFEIFHQRKNKTLYEVSVRIEKTQYKNSPAFIATITDITENKKVQKEKLNSIKELDESLIFQKAILDNAAHGIIATDTEGLITSFNKAAENMLGYKAEEVIGQHTPAIFHDLDEVVKRSKEFSIKLGELIEPGFKTFTCLADANLANGFDWTYISKDKKRTSIHLSVTTIRNKKDEVIGYLGISNDVSERRKKENLLIESRKEAEKALKVKSQFLANMSHEVRTPMNGIIGMTSILLDEVDSPEQIEKLLTIKESSMSLLQIINDILDISKIEANKLDVETSSFKLNHLIRNIIDLYKAAIEEKSIKLKYTIDSKIPDWIIGDPHRLKQILNNLLSNSIKFTKKGSVALEINLIGQQKESMKIAFKVIDSGVGIQEKDFNNIFKAFSQADTSTTRVFGGTGLGLSISKNLVELMGGKISVENNPIGGSIFSFSIKVKEGNQELDSIKKSEIIVSQLKSLKVLIVEDGATNQVIAKSFLKKLGHTSVIVENGVEAIAKLKEEKFDLILMDCHMPIMDGFEATQEIIRIYGDSRPRIVALTASVMKADIEKCYKVGMDDFLPKPLKLSDLSVALQKNQPVN
jgi:PAS domain S-box-containing protein